ncbi:MAG: cytochrome b [Rickettsiales bacterium]|jgi:cytochrome b561|nr:cytochrome b [Rickettsiales bacterium]
MKGWNKLLKILHWLSAVLVVFLFALGLWMMDLDYGHDLYQIAPFVHQAVGMVLLLLMIFRVIWRLKSITPDALESHSRIELVLGKIMHISLYVVIFVIILSGYVITTADGENVSVFGLFTIPALPFNFDYQADIAGVVHFYLACAIMIMALLHGAAALKHHFIDKDDTLRRMI